MNVCVTLVPSEVTSVFTSRSSWNPELTKRTFFTLRAASFARSSTAILSSSGTSIGSRCTGVIHVPIAGAAGASSTGTSLNGARCARRASPPREPQSARRAASSCSSRQIPSSHPLARGCRRHMIRRRLTAEICRSRVRTVWRRYRPTRTSAYDAPPLRATLSASFASSITSGSAEGAARVCAAELKPSRPLARAAAVAALAPMKWRLDGVDIQNLTRKMLH